MPFFLPNLAGFGKLAVAGAGAVVNGETTDVTAAGASDWAGAGADAGTVPAVGSNSEFMVFLIFWDQC